MSQFILCRNYQIMKHPTPYPHQLQQILARILLTIWLPAMCSPEATVAAPPPEVAAASTSAVDAASSSSGLQEERQQAPDITPAQELLAAAAQGKRVTVQSILAKREVDINTVDEQGQSALHQAMIAGHTKIAVLLIKHGANMALPDHQDKTPLGYAGTDSGYFSTIRGLVKLSSGLDSLIESGSMGLLTKP